MKRLLVVILALCGTILLTATDQPCKPKTVSITIGAGVRNFSEDSFKTIYEDTPMVYSVDVAVRIMRPLEVFLHSDYLSIDGKTTYTKEDTTLKITPLELGVRYIFSFKQPCKQKFFPYLGVGLGYYMLKEEFASGSPMENVDEKRMGFLLEGGLRFAVISSIFLDAKLKYITVKSENSTQLGGLAYMGGIGFSF